jgi:hypothetical protein
VLRAERAERLEVEELAVVVAVEAAGGRLAVDNGRIVPCCSEKQSA